jgi:hypothetical protein
MATFVAHRLPTIVIFLINEQLSFVLNFFTHSLPLNEPLNHLQLEETSHPKPPNPIIGLPFQLRRL